MRGGDAREAGGRPSGAPGCARAAEELERLCAEVAELRVERQILKRSVVLGVKEATKRVWAASSPTRGTTTRCHTRSAATAGVSLAWFE
jgi:hypothetical protein